MARVKVKSHEKLEATNIKSVIALLEQEVPITKKAACEQLNIAYNTKRLDSILSEYKEDILLRKRLMKKNRGKPWSDYDLKYLISGYLTGTSMSDLSKSLYRSLNMVKVMLNKLAVPLRDSTSTYRSPALLPEDSSFENLEPGELVWSARYDCIAEVCGTVAGAYKLWLFGSCNQFALQPWYELGVIPSIKELGMTYKDFETGEW
jgi:hypothetical protein